MTPPPPPTWVALSVTFQHSVSRLSGRQSKMTPPLPGRRPLLFPPLYVHTFFSLTVIFNEAKEEGGGEVESWSSDAAMNRPGFFPIKRGQGRKISRFLYLGSESSLWKLNDLNVYFYCTSPKLDITFSLHLPTPGSGFT